MTNQKFVIVLYDGTIYEVSKEIADKVFEAPAQNTKFIRIHGNAIALNSISQVTEASNYYNQHSKKKKADPRLEYKNYSKLPQPKQTYSQERHKKRLENMKVGFLKGVAKIRETNSVDYAQLKDYQKRTYNKMGEALNKIEQGEMPSL